MGGRGASSGRPAGGGLSALISNGQKVNLSKERYIGNYTNNNNTGVITYQGKDDDKTANFLAGTDKKVNLNDSQHADGYAYHDIPLNKLLLRLGVKGGPKVLSEADFNTYVRQTGEQVFYRGWSGGKSSAERFMNAQNNHVGNGRFGDGYYFTPDRSTAKLYATGGPVTKIALSPDARVVSLSEVQSRMRGSSTRLQSALAKTGYGGSGRTYGPNKGEAQMALKMGYNVVDVGSGYLYGITADAFVVSEEYV